MSVNNYLNSIASSAVLRDKEKDNIVRSLNTLKQRLEQHFGSGVIEHFVFGSYSRGTILPRDLDKNSDIDYMVVFRDDFYQPQTYLDRLRRFVNKYYPNSQIGQSNPTIALNLNHIKFELVPALKDWWYGYKIPAKNSDWNRWINTVPHDFNSELTETNKSNNYLIKPTVRLAKYWNALNNYPFVSYDLETELVGKSYFLVSLTGNRNLMGYFFSAMESLNYGWGASQSKRQSIDMLHSSIDKIKDFIRKGMHTNALAEIQRILPPTFIFNGLSKL